MSSMSVLILNDIGRNLKMNSKIMGIYQIKNIINNKIYIGSSKDINNRWKSHIGLLNNNKHHSWKLQSDWNVFKEDNFKFEIIEIINNSDSLLEIEQQWLDRIKCYKNDIGYNISNTSKSTNINKILDYDRLPQKKEIFFIQENKVCIIKLIEENGLDWDDIGFAFYLKQIFIKDNDNILKNKNNECVFQNEIIDIIHKDKKVSISTIRRRLKNLERENVVFTKPYYLNSNYKVYYLSEIII